MISRTTKAFWRLFEDLPFDVQRRARVAYQLWQADPFHPGLHFKCVREADALYSARIGLRWRALGLRSIAAGDERLTCSGSDRTPSTTD